MLPRLRNIPHVREVTMSLRRIVIPGMFVWLAAISLLHGWLNLALFGRSASRGTGDAASFRVGFLPVT
jgi:hypothetical protein